MRKREKSCIECKELHNVLYRCLYGGAKNWIFVCKTCLSSVKEKYQKDYQYGGTWKSKKNDR